jgi:chromosome segregation ATPase
MSGWGFDDDEWENDSAAKKSAKIKKKGVKKVLEDDDWDSPVVKKATTKLVAKKLSAKKVAEKGPVKPAPVPAPDASEPAPESAPVPAHSTEPEPAPDPQPQTQPPADDLPASTADLLAGTEGGDVVDWVFPPPEHEAQTVEDASTTEELALHRHRSGGRKVGGALGTWVAHSETPLDDGKGEASSPTVAADVAEPPLVANAPGEGEEAALRQQVVALKPQVASVAAVATGGGSSSDELREQLQAEKDFRAELEMTVQILTESKAKVSGEFSQKLQREERRSKALIKERDMLRRNADSKGEVEERMREKEQQVNDLISEGEKLTRQLGDKETGMRRLRAQIKGLETTKQSLTDRVVATETKLKSLEEAQNIMRVSDKETKRELVDTSKQSMALTAQVEEQERTINALRGENEELLEGLNETRDELNVHKQSLARVAEETSEQTSEAAEQAKQEMRAKMSMEQKDFEAREVALTCSLDELRTELERKTETLGRLEDRMRKDADNAERRRQEAEARCQDLERLVPEATRPLLRQIESLQRTQADRVSVWNDLERSLKEQLQRAEAAAAVAAEREKAGADKLAAGSTESALLTERLRAAECDGLEAEERVSRATSAAVEADREAQHRRMADLREADVRLKETVESERRRWASKEQQAKVEVDLKVHSWARVGCPRLQKD